jgi:ABC-2 type transport system permease protein
MNNVLAILRREVGAYVDAPMAYFAIPVYVVLVGGFALWFDDPFLAGVATSRGVHAWSGLFLVLLAPAVTMRLFAEERRTGSLELLATLPIRDEELVLGKFLAALALLLAAIAATVPMVAMFAWLGTPEIAEGAAPRVWRALTGEGLDPGPLLTGTLGLGLMAAALAAIGTACSAWTSNQVVAFLVALTLGVFPWAAGFFVDRLPVVLQGCVQALAFQPHADALAKGVVDVRDLVYWGGVCGVFLHAAVYSLERRRLG